MLRTVVAGVVALAIVLVFFAVLLLKVQEPVLFIVIGIGVLMMIWNIVDGIRGATVASEPAPADLPGGQQERGGAS